jgi:hypothetical protein
MTNSRALIGLIVDRSGSMASCQQEMQHAVNTFLKDQAEQDYEADASLAQFDNVYELVYPPTPIQDVPEYHLHPRNSTALLDAIGRFITDLGDDLKHRHEDQRPGRVLIGIVTDGYENSSTRYTREQIKDMIEHQKSAYKWDFVFLGANMDAVAEASKYGITHDSALTFDTRNAGVAMASMSNYATSYNMAGAAAFSSEDRKDAVSPTSK